MPSGYILSVNAGPFRPSVVSPRTASFGCMAPTMTTDEVKLVIGENHRVSPLKALPRREGLDIGVSVVCSITPGSLIAGVWPLCQRIMVRYRGSFPSSSNCMTLSEASNRTVPRLLDSRWGNKN